MLFKIKNDSVLNGKKGAYDPNDFELIDNYGGWNDSLWNYAGVKPDFISNLMRFYNITRKETVIKGSTGNMTDWGTDAASSDWYVRKMGQQPPQYNNNNTISEWIGEGIGSHYVAPISLYKSTISSLSYVVSEGYSGIQSVYGVDENKTVDQFLSNIIKADPDQTLVIHGFTDGTVKTGTNIVTDKDTLIVTSADAKSTTKYVITVVAGGLSSDAVLTSTTYDITTDQTAQYRDHNRNRAEVWRCHQ